PGYIKSVAMPNGIGVICEKFWQAKAAAETVQAVWNEPAAPHTTAEYLEKARRMIESAEGQEIASHGDDTPAAESDIKVEAEYTAPFLAHATMEPMNCTAYFDKTKNH